jgi:hypothetical protein
MLWTNVRKVGTCPGYFLYICYTRLHMHVRCLINAWAHQPWIWPGSEKRAVTHTHAHLWVQALVAVDLSIMRTRNTFAHILITTYSLGIVCVCVCVCVCVYATGYVCMCIYIYIYIMYLYALINTHSYSINKGHPCKGSHDLLMCECYLYV